MPVGLKRHLGLAVCGAGSRALDRDATAAEGHLATLMAVTHGGAIAVVTTLRPHNLIDLLLHQLVQYADRQRQQPFLRRAG